MRSTDHLFVIAYDVRDPRRWRRLFRVMSGRGEWLQLSVFQARLSRRGLVELKAAVSAVIRHDEDHVLILDLGPADDVKPRVVSLGKAFVPVARAPIIV